MVKGQGEAGAQDRSQHGVKRKVVEGDDADLPGKTWRKREYKRWCSLKFQGVGTEVFEADKISYHFHNMAKGSLQESELIFALKMWTNTMPTSSKMHGKNAEVRQCQLCRNGMDTLLHVVGNCITLKNNLM